MNIRNDFVGTLAHVGNLSAFYGLHENARLIFEGVRAMRPDNVYASFCLAISKLIACRFNEAIRILRDSVLKAEPENLGAKCFLGMALKHTGQDCEGDRLFREVIEAADDKTVDETILAREALNGNNLITLLLG